MYIESERVQQNEEPNQNHGSTDKQVYMLTSPVVNILLPHPKNQILLAVQRTDKQNKTKQNKAVLYKSIYLWVRGKKLENNYL